MILIVEARLRSTETVAPIMKAAEDVMRLAPPHPQPLSLQGRGEKSN